MGFDYTLFGMSDDSKKQSDAFLSVDEIPFNADNVIVSPELYFEYDGDFKIVPKHIFIRGIKDLDYTISNFKVWETKGADDELIYVANEPCIDIFEFVEVICDLSIYLAKQGKHVYLKYHDGLWQHLHKGFFKSIVWHNVKDAFLANEPDILPEEADVGLESWLNSNKCRLTATIMYVKAYSYLLYLISKNKHSIYGHCEPFTIAVNGGTPISEERIYKDTENVKSVHLTYTSKGYVISGDVTWGEYTISDDKLRSYIPYKWATHIKAMSSKNIEEKSLTDAINNEDVIVYLYDLKVKGKVLNCSVSLANVAIYCKNEKTMQEIETRFGSCAVRKTIEGVQALCCSFCDLSDGDFAYLSNYPVYIHAAGIKDVIGYYDLLSSPYIFGSWFIWLPKEKQDKVYNMCVDTFLKSTYKVLCSNVIKAKAKMEHIKGYIKSEFAVVDATMPKFLSVNRVGVMYAAVDGLAYISLLEQDDELFNSFRKYDIESKPLRICIGSAELSASCDTFIVEMGKQRSAFGLALYYELSKRVRLEKPLASKGSYTVDWHVSDALFASKIAKGMGISVNLVCDFTRISGNYNTGSRVMDYLAYKSVKMGELALSLAFKFAEIFKPDSTFVQWSERGVPKAEYIDKCFGKVTCIPFSNVGRNCDISFGVSSLLSVNGLSAKIPLFKSEGIVTRGDQEVYRLVDSKNNSGYVTKEALRESIKAKRVQVVNMHIGKNGHLLMDKAF